MTYNVRLATLEDAEDIVSLLHPHYFGETAFTNLHPDLNNVRHMVRTYLTNSVTIVGEKDGQIVGVASVWLGNTFYSEIEADLQLFVTHKEHRATGLARLLAQAVVQAADNFDAKIIYAACRSGLSEENDKLFQNLWRKFGFRKLGTIMMRNK